MTGFPEDFAHFLVPGAEAGDALCKHIFTQTGRILAKHVEAVLPSAEEVSAHSHRAFTHASKPSQHLLYLCFHDCSLCWGVSEASPSCVRAQCGKAGSSWRQVSVPQSKAMPRRWDVPASWPGLFPPGFTEVLEELASSPRFRGRFLGYSLMSLQQSSALGGACIGAKGIGAAIKMNFKDNVKVFYQHTFWWQSTGP